MKKSLFKLILGVFATVMLFSSCLGDGGYESGNNNAFAYITTIDGKQCAAMDGCYFTSTLIETLTVGRCYILGYRTNLEAVNSKVFLAEDTAQPIELTTTYGRVNTPTVENTFNSYDFRPYYGSFDSFYGDNWGVVYTAKLKEKDTPRAHFFYDTEKQYEMIDGVRKDVGKNQIIIDVRFDYIPGADGSTVKKERLTVGNLSQIKNTYKDSDKFDEGSGTYVDVAIKFRYNQLQPDDVTVKEDVYTGSWTSAPYYFRYYKAE